MLLVLAFCHRDARAAVNLLHWMRELDSQQSRHQLLLVAANGMDTDLRRDVFSAGREAFSQTTCVATQKPDERPWPQAPNTMFRCAVAFVQSQFKSHFWWHEPDCIPLSPGWLDEIETEYLRAKRPFMGAVVDIPCRHLTGCAVYPKNISQYNPNMLHADRHAWDCVAPHLTLPHTHHTTLFHHQWAEPNDVTYSIPPTFPNREKLKIISSRAVVFHRNKDHTLIDRLREERVERAGPDGAEVVGEEESVAAVAQNQVAESEVAENLSKKPTIESPIVSHEPDRAVEPVIDSPSRSTTIFTYHQPIPGLPDAGPLLDLWRELWSIQGFTPVVLTEHDARDHPQFKPFRSTIAKLPTVNHPLYERACYMRHLAMLARGGGFLTDYDVMPRSFTPDDLQTATSRWPLVILEPTRVPCAIRAGVKGFQQIIDFISSYTLDPLRDIYAGRPHTSDMEILRRSKFKRTAHCVEHLCSGGPERDQPGDGWRVSPMIHFSTYSFHKLKKTDKGGKPDWIKEALAALPPLKPAQSVSSEL